MLEAAFSLRDLGIFLLFVALLVALVYLVLTLKRLSELIGGIHRIVEENERSIKAFLDSAPEVSRNALYITESLKTGIRHSEESVPAILSNVEGITGSINSSVQSIDSSITSVGSGINSTVAALQGNTGDGGASFSLIMEALRLLLSLFSPPKRRKKKR